MGRLLQKALAKESKLPEVEQESERRWDELFTSSQDMLAEMAAEAIREDEAGLTQPLDPDAI